MMNANSFERRSWRTVTGIVCQYCKKAAERESFLWKFCMISEVCWGASAWGCYVVKSVHLFIFISCLKLCV